MKGSELRQDPATKEWVVIAPERSQRPQQNKRSAEERHTLYSSHCPFCPGNESLTPPELLRIGHDGWQVRVVPNKFPALHSNAGPVGRNCFFRSAPGSGHHEVIIESPAHNLELADMPEEHTAVPTGPPHGRVHPAPQPGEGESHVARVDHQNRFGIRAAAFQPLPA